MAFSIATSRGSASAISQRPSAPRSVATPRPIGLRPVTVRAAAGEGSPAGPQLGAAVAAALLLFTSGPSLADTLNSEASKVGPLESLTGPTKAKDVAPTFLKKDLPKVQDVLDKPGPLSAGDPQNAVRQAAQDVTDLLKDQAKTYQAGAGGQGSQSVGDAAKGQTNKFQTGLGEQADKLKQGAGNLGAQVQAGGAKAKGKVEEATKKPFWKIFGTISSESVEKLYEERADENKSTLVVPADRLEESTKSLGTQLKDVGEAVKEGAEKLSSGAEEQVEKVKDEGVKAKGKLAEGTKKGLGGFAFASPQNVGDAAKEQADKLKAGTEGKEGPNIGEAIKGVGENIQAQASKLQTGVGSQMDKLVQMDKEGPSAGGTPLQAGGYQTKEPIKKSVGTFGFAVQQGLNEKIKSAGEAAKGKVEEVKSATTEQAGKLKEGPTINEALQNVGNIFTGNSQSGVGEQADKLKDKAGSVVSQVKAGGNQAKANVEQAKKPFWSFGKSVKGQTEDFKAGTGEQLQKAKGGAESLGSQIKGVGEAVKDKTNEFKAGTNEQANKLRGGIESAAPEVNIGTKVQKEAEKAKQGAAEGLQSQGAQIKSILGI